MMKYLYNLYNVLLTSAVQNAMRTNHLRLAALEQEKADENVQKLVDKQTVSPCSLDVLACGFLLNDIRLVRFLLWKLQRETKAILDDFLRLNKQLEKKQKLELEINHLSGKLQVMELKPGDEDPESREKKDKLKEELNEKIDELKYVENYNRDLISRERKSSDELREAREVLISV